MVRNNQALHRGRTPAVCSTAICAIAALTLNSAQAQSTGLRAESAAAMKAKTPLLSSVADRSDGQPVNGPASFADLAEKVEPAVVGVTSKAAPRDAEALPGEPSGAPDESDQSGSPPTPGTTDRDGGLPKNGQLVNVGSGFFISSDGYIVTNNHVVDGSDTAQIRTHDDKVYTAKVVGKDPISDLALLKVDGNNTFNSVKLADHSPRVGDWVLAIGNPFGLGGTVTAGIVSARQRSLEAVAIDDLIQIDAPINRGDSGGPSFDANGDVVGVNTMIFSPSGGSVGVAFAVPAETVKTVIPQLKDKGSVVRGSIGATVQSITPDIAEGLGMGNVRGAIIAEVADDSPAAHAGLASGDVITAVSGEPIKDAKDLTKKIHGMAPGSAAKLDVLREGKQTSVNVTLGQLQNQAAASPSNPR